MRALLVLLVFAGCESKETKTCPEGEILRGEACVSRCADGKEFREGECLDAPSSPPKDLPKSPPETLAKEAKADAGAELGTVEALAAIRDRMCACTDKRCANAANNAYGQWTSSPEGRVASKRDKKRVMKVVDAYTACLNKLMK